MLNDNSIDDVESLRSALREVLKEAETNDIEVEGSFRIEAPVDQNWEIQIWQVE